jgi:hypothetical protein
LLDEAAVETHLLSMSHPFCEPHTEDIVHATSQIRDAILVLDDLSNAGHLWEWKLSFLASVHLDEMNSKASTALAIHLDALIPLWTKLNNILRTTRVCDMGKSHVISVVKQGLVQMETCASCLDGFLREQRDLHPRLGILSDNEVICFISLLCRRQATTTATIATATTTAALDSEIASLLPMMFARGVKTINPFLGVAIAHDDVKLQFRPVLPVASGSLNDILSVLEVIEVNMSRAIGEAGR